jgi:Anti-sigma-K factor rskA
VQGVKARSLHVLAVGAAAAVGAALGYYLDPLQGPARRRAAREWMAATVRGLLGEDSGTSPLRRLGPPKPEPRHAPGEAEPARTFAMHVVEDEPPGARAPIVAEEQGDPGRASLEVVWWKRDDGLRAAEQPEPSPVVYLEGDHASPTRIVSYDRRPESLPPLVGVPWHRRLTSRVLAGAAAAAASAAIVLAGWAVVLESDAESSSAANPPRLDEQARAVSLLSQSDARRIPVRGSGGRLVLVVGRRGQAALVLSGLARAPRGKVHAAWVIDGEAPTPAGLFSGAERVVELTKRVPRGATVAVTLERVGGTRAPTSRPILTARNA